MIEAEYYIKLVRNYFGYLEDEFNFKVLEEAIKGNVLYDIQYKDKSRIISISYENLEDYLLVIIFILQNGQLPDYDDKTKTLHLDQINSKLYLKIANSEIDLNNGYFIKFRAKTDFERKLIKLAKELRLCLKYFNEL